MIWVTPRATTACAAGSCRRPLQAAAIPVCALRSCISLPRPNLSMTLVRHSALGIKCTGRKGAVTQYTGGPKEGARGHRGRPGREPLQRAGGPLRQGRHQRRRGGSTGGEPAAVRHGCRRQQERGSSGGSPRRPEGSDHEGGAADGHHPRGAAGRICRAALPATVAGPADGASLRAPAHDRRAWDRLAKPLSQLRAAVGGLCLPRPGASRRGA